MCLPSRGLAYRLHSGPAATEARHTVLSPRQGPTYGRLVDYGSQQPANDAARVLSELRLGVRRAYQRATLQPA